MPRQSPAPPAELQSLSLRGDAHDPAPAYEQLRRQLARMIKDGSLPPQTQLPPVRRLAADLGVGKGAVARAYQELARAGLVAGRSGGGTWVDQLPPAAPTGHRQRELHQRAKAYALQARELGFSDDEAVSALVAVLGLRPALDVER